MTTAKAVKRLAITFTLNIMFIDKLCVDIAFTRLTQIKIEAKQSAAPKYISFVQMRSLFSRIALLFNSLNPQREEQIFHTPIEVTRAPKRANACGFPA